MQIAIGLIITYFAILVLVAIGWVLNIVSLIAADELVTWGALEVIRVVGIFIVPLGSLLGWFA